MTLNLEHAPIQEFVTLLTKSLLPGYFLSPVRNLVCQAAQNLHETSIQPSSTLSALSRAKLHQHLLCVIKIVLENWARGRISLRASRADGKGDVQE